MNGCPIPRNLLSHGWEASRKNGFPAMVNQFFQDNSFRTKGLDTQSKDGRFLIVDVFKPGIVPTKRLHLILHLILGIDRKEVNQ